MRSTRNALFFLIAFAFLMGTPQSIYAQDETPITDDEVNAIAQDLYCPVCENVPLDVCPTQACALWRDLIREKLELGWSKQEIKVFFAEQYGDKVLSVPQLKGFNWIMYILPPLILAGGALLTFNLVRRSKRTQARTSSTDQPLLPASNDTLMEEIEKDLKEGL